MKPHCPQCEQIIAHVAEAAEKIQYGDDVERLAGLLTLACIVSPRANPVGDNRWDIAPKTAEEEAEEAT
jgi:hypothetical protein